MLVGAAVVVEVEEGPEPLTTIRLDKDTERMKAILLDSGNHELESSESDSDFDDIDLEDDPMQAAIDAEEKRLREEMLLQLEGDLNAAEEAA